MKKVRIASVFSLSLILLLVSVLVQAKPTGLVCWIQEPQLGEFLAKVLPAIEQNYNLKIEVVQKTDDIMEQALTSAAVAREGCDFYYWWTGPVAINMAKKGLLTPLNDLFSKEKWSTMAGYDTAMVGDKIYVMPTNVDWFGLAYNKKIFKEVGLSAGDVSTWDGFLAACAKLKKAGYQPVALADKEGYSTDWWLSNLVAQTFDSSDELFKAFNTGNYSHPKILEALARLKDIYNKGYFYEGGLALSFDEYNNELLSGKAAMGIAIPWNYGGILRKEMPDAFGLTTPPAIGRPKARVINAASGGFFITAYTKYPKLAAKVIDELTNAENASMRYKTWGVIPGNTQWDKNLIQDPDEKQLLQAERGGYNYNYFKSSAAWDEQLKNMSLYLQGEISAKELTERMAKAEAQ